MKKRIISLLIVFLLVILQTNSYAQGNIQVSLTEPTSIIKGQEVEYSINVQFLDAPMNYSNLFVTLRISDSLDFRGLEMVGVTPVPGQLEATATPNAQNRYNYLTVKVTDTNALAGASSFSVKMRAVVNDKAVNGEFITNTYSVAYETISGNRNSYQTRQTSTVAVGVANPTPTPTPTPEPIPEPTPIPVPIPTPTPTPTPTLPMGTTRLSIYTGQKYASFMNRIKGFTDPGSSVEIEFLNATPESKKLVEANAAGEFMVDIPTGFNSFIVINAKHPQKNSSGTLVLSQITESIIIENDVLELVDAVTLAGKYNQIKPIIDAFQKDRGVLSIALGTDVPSKQELFELYRNLYFAAMQGNDAVSTLVHDSFMNGYPEGNFLPGNSITRAESAAILSRIIAKGEVTDSRANFPDVPAGQWYTKYIAHLTSLGIMKGYEDGKFMPTNKITRAEFATIISRLLNLNMANPVNFKDMDYNYWAAGDIMKVATANIMKGYPDNTFGAKLNVTRAEAATIINRSLGRTPDENFINQRNIVNFTDIKNHWAYYQIVEATYKHNYTIQNGREIFQ